MRQLTSLDAQFLALENDRQVGHVGSLALFDPATAPGGELTRASLERLIRARLLALPAPGSDAQLAAQASSPRCSPPALAPS
jgi:hypothetical protein